jgi:UDP-glucose 4-epimerase
MHGETNWSPALGGVDVVVHCAARVHMMHDPAADPPVAFRAVNVQGTVRLAQQAAAAGVRRFVFVSSVKVHGDATAPGRPFRADDAAAPQDAYGQSKWEAEQALQVFVQSVAMELVIVRPPLVYGPGVRANFAALMRWVQRGWPLPFAALDNRRSLVALDNLVDLLCLCLHHPGAAGQVFMVSDGEDVSTAELVRRLAEVLGRPARLFPIPVVWLERAAALVGKRPAVQRLCGSLQVDIEKTRSVLGWQPPLSLEQGLQQLVRGRP